jgi:hypothetical protein
MDLLESNMRGTAERTDLQRKTLLQLLVVLRRFANAMGTAGHFRSMEHRKNGDWPVILPVGMIQAISDTSSCLHLLSQRVTDRSLREALDRLADSAREALATTSNDKAELVFTRLDRDLKQTKNRLGVLLRKLL